MKKAWFYETPIGRIGIAEENEAITNVFFGGTVTPLAYEQAETPLLCRAGTQLAEYFDKKRRTFDLPLYLEGTEFESAVWEGLMRIPYGETRTYSELAKSLGRERAYRAVGHANSRNPVSIFVPCHRVIGVGGRLTGYAGTIPAKEFLLRLEGVIL